MDITEVKNINGITTTKHDSYIATMIPLMEEAVKDYCNNSFLDEDENEVIPGGVKIAIAKWIQFNMLQSGVSSRSQGVSYSYDTEVPESIKTHLRRYRRVKF